jgi:hypothetical protein|tara:strand:- start:395 stop:541 length:147 start_codon:yes stop_codon:yes gene_type:complete
MSKEGSLRRIEIYKEFGNTALLEKEETFFKENYGSVEEPKKEKSKKSN